jgi:CRISPR-associated protein Cas2
MLVILTYDVNITSNNGVKRLRNVAKICESYGVRVQNSVFELLLDNSQLTYIKFKLEKIIDKENDSIRFYLLGNKWDRKVEIIGKEAVIKQADTLIL